MELTVESKIFCAKKNFLTYKMANAGDELVDIGQLGIPGRHPAHLLVMGIPIVEKRPVPQSFNSGGWKNGEDAVDLWRPIECHARKAHGLLVEMRCHDIGMTGIFDPEVISEERRKLCRDVANF